MVSGLGRARRPLFRYRVVFVCDGSSFSKTAKTPQKASNPAASRPTLSAASSRPFGTGAASRPADNPQDKQISKRSKASEQGASCATGCAAVKPTPSDLTPEKLRSLLKAFATEPMQAGSQALEAILFHDRKALRLFQKASTRLLDTKRKRFLLQELQKQHVWLSLRIIDRNGTRRVFVPPQRILLDKHFHIHAEHTTNLQAPSFGGRTKRVGLHHIWIRI